MRPTAHRFAYAMGGEARASKREGGVQGVWMVLHWSARPPVFACCAARPQALNEPASRSCPGRLDPWGAAQGVVGWLAGACSARPDFIAQVRAVHGCQRPQRARSGRSASKRGAAGRRRQGRRGCTDAAPALAQEDLKTQHFLWQLLCIEGDARRARAEAARRAAEAEAAGAGLAGAEREAAAKRREAAGFAKERALLERKLAARRAEVEKKVRAHAPPEPPPSSP